MDLWQTIGSWAAAWIGAALLVCLLWYAFRAPERDEHRNDGDDGEAGR